MGTEQIKELNEAAAEGERAPPLSRVGPDVGQVDPVRGRAGKLPSPSRCRDCIEPVRSQMKVLERRVCPGQGKHRPTKRLLPQGRGNEERLIEDMIELAASIRSTWLSSG